MKLEKWWQKYLSSFLVSEHEINPEYEEKPVADNLAEISEDYHGGKEITFSMEHDNVQGRNSNYDSKNDSNENSENNEQSKNNNSENNEQDKNDDSASNEGGSGRDYSCSEKNSESVVEISMSAIDRKLMTAFQRFIERIAEVDTKYELQLGTEKLSVKQLMKRSMSKKSLSSCYVDTYKNQVILLIDTSGSMDWWSDILSKMTRMAVIHGDIEIYEAPNGIITRKINCKIDSDFYDWSEYHDFSEKFINETKNRVIIYIGDFDGADTPYRLSMKNRVYWICNEDRYYDTIEHDWCSYPLSSYPRTCKIMWAYNENDLIDAFSFRRTIQKVNNSDYYDY